MNINKSKMRSFIFYHLDGIALIPTVLTLGKNNILNEISENKTSLSSLVKKFNASEGYLNVALRLLCCQGWLSQYFEKNDVFFVKNKSIDLKSIYNTYKIIEPFFEKFILTRHTLLVGGALIALSCGISGGSTTTL